MTVQVDICGGEPARPWLDIDRLPDSQCAVTQVRQDHQLVVHPIGGCHVQIAATIKVSQDNVDRFITGCIDHRWFKATVALIDQHGNLSGSHQGHHQVGGSIIIQISGRNRPYIVSNLMIDRLSKLTVAQVGQYLDTTRTQIDDD